MLTIENKTLCEYCFTELPPRTKQCPNCSGISNIVNYPTALREKTILAGRYSVGKVLGKGGFGITYLCYDLKEQKKVAIKEYLPDSLAHRNTGENTVKTTSESTENSFRVGVEKFYEEAKLVSRFNGNPNIISVYEFFYENNTTYFVMEYLSGMDMKRYLQKKNGKISEGEALYVADRATEALTIIHSTNTYHRDISPDNIFLCENGEVKLIDFGAARQTVADVSNSLSVILKPGFAPLEQYQRKGKQGPWTDIYALGATIYMAVTGRMLDDAMTRLDDPHLDMEGIAPALAEALKKMLEIRVEDRYQDVLAVRRDLAALPITPVPPQVRPAEQKNQCEFCETEIPTGEKQNTSGSQTVLMPKKGIKKIIGLGTAAVLIIAAGILIGVMFAGNREEPAPVQQEAEETKSAAVVNPENGIGNVQIDLDEVIPEEVNITLEQEELTLTEGETVLLKAVVESNKDKTYSVNWSSDDKKIAMVDSDGEIVATGVGTATITARVNDTTEASCTVTVKKKIIAVSKIELDKTEVILKPKQSITLKATVEPSDADDKTVTWSSGNTDTATVQNGKITAVKPGQTTITAKTGNGKKASCTVKVPGITEVKVQESTVTINAGETHAFQGITIAGYETSQLTDEEKKVTLSSSDSSVVSVSGHSVTGKKAGTATITFTVPGGVKTTCKVTVKEVAVSGIKLNKSNVTLDIGKTETLTATVSPANASNKTVTWTSSNTNVATVSNGKITAVGEGSATITAKSGSVTATCTVKVKPAVKILASGKCGDNVNWTLDENYLLRISGTGKIRNYDSYEDVPWYNYNSKIKNVIIENGITEIGSRAFKYCRELTNTTIPNSVTSIGDGAFHGCDSLTNIIIPNSVTSIGDDAFNSCDSLTNITIPKSVIALGEGAFEWCDSLKEVIFEQTDDVTLITISAWTFSYCEKLEKVVLPKRLNRINEFAFNKCTSLKTLELPEKLQIIENSVFDDCTSLKSIVIPKSLYTMGFDPFGNWTSSQTIYIKGRKSAPSSWNSGWDYKCNAKIKWNQ